MTHPLFADWHRAVTIDPSQIDLNARWQAIETFTKQMTAARALALVRLAHERSADAAETQAFADAFKAQEPAFPMRDNQRLLAVLAAAAGVHLISRADRIAVLLAYATSAAAAVRWNPILPDLAVESARFLLERSASIRDRTSPPAGSPARPIWTKAQTDLIDSAAELAPVRQALAELGQAADAALTSAARHAQALQSWHVTTLARLEEDTTMLSWLLSGGSSTLRCAWGDLPPSTAALIGGWELAALVRMLPGPSAAHRLLSQFVTVGLRSAVEHRPVTLQEAVREFPATVTAPDMDEAILDLTPILAQVHGRPLSGNAHGKAIQLVELVSQSYSEILLVRSKREAP